jgi:hypothetical protein
MFFDRRDSPRSFSVELLSAYAVNPVATRLQPLSL